MTHPLDRHCDTCGAAIGTACIGKRGKPRLTPHRARGIRSQRFYAEADISDLTTESPIESSLVSMIRGWIDHHGISAEVRTQVSIGPYRADIVVEEGARKLVVECDGLAFHSAEHSVERDRRRDRYCVSRGYYVMRFSGSDIHRDVRGCAAQVGMWIRLR